MSSPTEDRRRSSGNFANLTNMKRDPNNEAAAARRLSHSDQHAKPGVLGGMWNSFTKGHTAPQPAKDNKAPGGPAKQSIHRTGAGTLG